MYRVPNDKPGSLFLTCNYDHRPKWPTRKKRSTRVYRLEHHAFGHWVFSGTMKQGTRSSVPRGYLLKNGGYLLKTSVQPFHIRLNPFHNDSVSQIGMSLPFFAHVDMPSPFLVAKGLFTGHWCWHDRRGFQDKPPQPREWCFFNELKTSRRFGLMGIRRSCLICFSFSLRLFSRSHEDILRLSRWIARMGTSKVHSSPMPRWERGPDKWRGTKAPRKLKTSRRGEIPHLSRPSKGAPGMMRNCS